MTLKTGDDYRAALRDERQIYVAGERVPDITANPLFSGIIDDAIAQTRAQPTVVQEN